MCAFGAVVSWCLAIRPRVLIDDDQVVVVGPVSTTTFPRADLKRALGGEQYLILERTSGARIEVWAVQNAKITIGFGGGGAVDHAAGAINLLLSGKDPASDPDRWNSPG